MIPKLTLVELVLVLLALWSMAGIWYFRQKWAFRCFCFGMLCAGAFAGLRWSH